MATLGSRKVTAVVVPPNATEDGKELLVEFQNGLAKVPKCVKKFLLKNGPDLYFDPLVGEASGGQKFDDDYAALEYYISKIKHTGSPAKLCSILKGQYESLQGELMSGKYNVKTEEKPIAKKVKSEEKPVVEDVDEDDSDDESLVTGAGDKIKVKKNKE